MTIAQEAMCLYCFLSASGLTFLIFNCASLLLVLHSEKSKLKPPHGGGLVGLFICASVSCELGDELCEVVAPLVELFLFCLLFMVSFPGYALQGHHEQGFCPGKSQL